MSEKKFYVVYHDEYDYDLNYVADEKDNKLDAEDCCDLLNQLSEENEQLREYIDTIFDGNTHICEYIDIEDVKFYCTMNKLYCNSTCTYCKCYDEKNMVNLVDRIREVVE